MDHDLGYLVGLACGGVVGAIGTIAVIVAMARRTRAAGPIAAAGCPRCGSTEATPVTYTWWGGALGPKLLSHVECASCSTAYNGKTGRPNTLGIAIYLIVSTTIVLAAIVAFFFLRA